MDIKPKKIKVNLFPLIFIGFVALVLILVFAWFKGWLSSESRLTNKKLYSVIEQGNPDPFPEGYRRAHAKGVCFIGTFNGNGQASNLSKATLFQQQELPVLGRFSIGSGDPYATDGENKTLAMALLIKDSRGDEWRMAMNNVPYFIVSHPEGIVMQASAFKKDPITKEPDPEKIKAFLAAFPEAEKFLEWSKTSKWPDSWAGAEYNSVNSFKLNSQNGTSQYIRWVMKPRAPVVEWTNEQRKLADENYLSNDIFRRLEKETLYWDMVITLAAPEDAVNDPSQPWPETRQKIIVGQLQITKAFPQKDGKCRDVNFDPTITPAGVAISNDPILSARSGAYSYSFRDRITEIAQGHSDNKVVSK